MNINLIKMYTTRIFIGTTLRRLGIIFAVCYGDYIDVSFEELFPFPNYNFYLHLKKHRQLVPKELHRHYYNITIVEIISVPPQCCTNPINTKEKINIPNVSRDSVHYLMTLIPGVSQN